MSFSVVSHHLFNGLPANRELSTAKVQCVLLCTKALQKGLFPSLIEWTLPGLISLSFELMTPYILHLCRAQVATDVDRESSNWQPFI